MQFGVNSELRGVVGIMPEALVEREISHGGLTELHVVGSMHERKALMSELSDGFVELFETPRNIRPFKCATA